MIEYVATATVPTRWAEFSCHAYRRPDGVEHLALVLGRLDDAPLVRVHSEGRGALVYLRGQEGRGIGLGEKIRAYALQENGYDTVDANLALGHPADARDYSDAAGILRHLGAMSVRLLTNNPDKSAALTAHGIDVIAREPIVIAPTAANAAYLHTKRERMGHASA